MNNIKSAAISEGEQKMKLFRTKTFTLVTGIMIAAQLLAACAPSTQSPTQVPVQPTQATQPPEAAPTMSMTPEPAVTEPASQTDPLAFRQAVRKLWEDHITWTRVYIINVAADMPEADATAERLLQNQVDIGNAIKPFYGDEAGEGLTALLKDHILIAADLLAAAKAGDNPKVEEANARWQDNANQIAALLSGANPDHWPQAEMEAMMKSHLDLTLQEATARLNGDWAADIAAYDQVHEDILKMADMLADGIVAQFPDQFASEQASQAQADLTLAMDKLWEDHVSWTRFYILSATSDLPDADATAERLLQNQVDIGNAVKPFYGDEAGEQLTSLLKEHILIAVNLVTAAKAGDNARLEDAQARWQDNANQIAALLSGANPDNWPQAEMESMMKSHLDLTLEEATARLDGDWAADIAAYDQVHGQILEMSDMLTQGIVAQFPDKFQ
jgi:hypothetical protein